MLNPLKDEFLLEIHCGVNRLIFRIYNGGRKDREDSWQKSCFRHRKGRLLTGYNRPHRAKELSSGSGGVMVITGIGPPRS